MNRRQLILNSGMASALFLGSRPGRCLSLGLWTGFGPGRRTLQCKWQSRKGKYLCDLGAGSLEAFDFTELYVNGKLQTRARFPNRDSAQPPDGAYAPAVRGIPAGASSPDPIVEPYPGPLGTGIVGIEFDPLSFSMRRWAKPEEATVHLYSTPGSLPLQRRILTLDYDRNLIWFDYRNRAHSDSAYADQVTVDGNSLFFVENVYEEMDGPGEWYLSRQSNSLYFRPPNDLDMDHAIFQIPL